MSVYQVWFSETVLPCGIPTPNTVLAFDVQGGGSWWKWTGIEAMSFHVLDSVHDEGQILFGDFSGRINQMLVGSSDLGQEIAAKWTTKWFDLGTPEAVKIFRAVAFQVDQIGNPLSVTWETDDGQETAQFTGKAKAKYNWNDRWVWNDAAGSYPTGLWYNGPLQTALEYSLPQTCMGRRIRFIIEETSSNTPFRILGISLDVRLKRQRYRPEV